MKNIEIACKLYDAFSRHDGETMSSLYTENSEFSDPVFPNLRGPEIGAMWRRLCSSGKDLKIEYKIVAEPTATSVVVQWDAYYTFSKTGRRVHNIITATLETHDGRIFNHVDSFSFWRWSRQAFGVLGIAVGWTGWFQRKVQSLAKK